MPDETTRLLLEVLGRDRGASRMLRGVGDAAGDAADAVDDLSGSTDRVGQSATDAEKKVRTLDERIDHQRKTIADLAREIEKSPDELPLFKTLGKEQSTLRRLERIKKLLPGEQDGESSAEQVSRGFFRRMISSTGKMSEQIATSAVKRIPTAIGGALSALPPQVQTVIVGGIVAAIAAGASFIGAAVAGAIVAGLGTGVIAAGVVAAFQDTRIMAAGRGLGQTVMAGLKDAAGVFVGPTLRAIDIIRAGFADILPDIQKAFAAAAPYVDNLARGVVAFVKNTMPGLTRAIERSGPLVETLGRGIAMTGRAFSQFFDDISSDSAGSRQALYDLFTLISATIVITGKLISWLTTAYRAASFVGKVLSGDVVGSINSMMNAQIMAQDPGDEYSQQLRDIAEGAKDTGSELAKTTGTVGTLGAALQPSIARTDLMRLSMMAAAEAAGTLAEALRIVNGDALDAREAEANYQQAIDDATAAIKANGATLELNTEKGRANDAALRGLAEATMAKADADYRAKAATGDLAGAQRAATADLEAGRQKFIQLADKMGLSTAQAKALADQIFKIPTSWTTNLSVRNGAALAAIAQVQQNLSRVKSKNITIGVYWTSKGDLKLPGGTQLKGSSAGGPITGPGPKGKDSQVRALAPGEHVLTASDVDAMGGQSAVAEFRKSLHGGIPKADLVSRFTRTNAPWQRQAAVAVPTRTEVHVSGTGSLATLFLQLIRTQQIKMTVVNNQVVVAGA